MAIDRAAGRQAVKACRSKAVSIKQAELDMVVELPIDSNGQAAGRVVIAVSIPVVRGLASESITCYPAGP